MQTQYKRLLACLAVALTATTVLAQTDSSDAKPASPAAAAGAATRVVAYLDIPRELMESKSFDPRLTNRVHLSVIHVQDELITNGVEVTMDVEPDLRRVRLTGFAVPVQQAVDALTTELESVRLRLRELAAQSEDEEERALSRLVIDIDWQGGELGDLVDLVRQLCDVNVVYGDSITASAIIPAMTVNSVRPEVFFKAIGMLPQSEGARVVVQVAAPEAAPGPQPRVVKAALPVIVLTTVVDKAALRADRSLPRTEVCDISRTAKRSPESVKELIDAISFVLGADGGRGNVSVNYHEASGILVLHGSEPSLGTVLDVVELFAQRQ